MFYHCLYNKVNFTSLFIMLFYFYSSIDDLDKKGKLSSLFPFYISILACTLHFYEYRFLGLVKLNYFILNCIFIFIIGIIFSIFSELVDDFYLDSKNKVQNVKKSKGRQNHLYDSIFKSIGELKDEMFKNRNKEIYRQIYSDQTFRPKLNLNSIENCNKKSQERIAIEKENNDKDFSDIHILFDQMSDDVNDYNEFLKNEDLRFFRRINNDIDKLS